MLPRFLVALCSLGLAVPAAGAAPPDLDYGACPPDRSHIESELLTAPEDGDYYTRQRLSIYMAIPDVLEAMGGLDNAYAIADATRADAIARLESGLEGPAERDALDTILRADALIAILDCLADNSSI